MMRIIPTWKVRYFPLDLGDESEGLEMRVPETNLESFLHVLIFNGVSEFQALLEDKENSLLAATNSTMAGTR